jgi:hypothetical protein
MCRLIFLILGVITTFCFCTSVQESSEDVLVIVEVFESIPKAIHPPPPNPSLEKIQPNKLIKNKDLKLRYAINKRFIVDSTLILTAKKVFNNDVVSNFKTKSIDSTINSSLLKYYLSGFPVVNYQKLNHENIEIDGVVSFTRVYFNDFKNEAIVGLGINRGRLDANYSIYYLKKINGKWSIISYKLIEFS